MNIKPEQLYTYKSRFPVRRTQTTSPYIYRCGTCGEEIRADTNECPSCKQKIKQDRRTSNKEPSGDHLKFQPISNSLNVKQQRDEIVRLFKEGQLSSAEIARKLGVSAPVVWAYKAHITMGTYESKKNRNYYKNRRHDEILNFVKPTVEQISNEEKIANTKKLISKMPIKKPAEAITDRRIVDIRQRYPRAYEPWSNEEDKLLLKLCNKKQSKLIWFFRLCCA